MRNGFTLIELLVVMGIRGLMGTISVGGYRAMQRGMEERGVMQTVNSVIRTAYQRAQIDRQPTAVYFWNETLRSETEDHNAIVVGKAVAVRRYGRFSDVRQNMLVDEFADLNLTYQSRGTDEEGSSGSTQDAFFIYPMEKLSDIQSSSQLRRTLVESKVKNASESVLFLTRKRDESIAGDDNANEISAWGFVIKDKGGVSWKPGMAYGMEFIQIELPHNYIFGTDYSSSAERPIREAGTIVFDVGVNSGGGLTTGGSSGRNTISVSSLRQEGNSVKAKLVATSDNPEKNL